MNRVAFKTVGCRLNQAETAELAGLMQSHGWQVVPFGDRCEVTVIHTCAVTSKAEQTCARFARMARRMNPRTFVVLAGCAAEIHADELIRRTGADIALGQARKRELPRILEGTFHGARRRSDGDATPLFDTQRAIIRAQDGCDFRCSYCVVPAARGASRSRPVKEIIDEVRRLSDCGFLEFVLSGANLGCYADGSRGLVDLLAAMEKIPGVARIRLSSIESSTVERQVVEHMADSEKLCRFLHVPLQSGDNRVLAAMRRRYDVESYRRFTDFAVSMIPRLGLGTDVIAGFPGEDEKAFANTTETIRALPFSNVHVFAYSARPATAAAALGRRVPPPVVARRSGELIAIGAKKRRDFAAGFIGRRVSVLVEQTEDVRASGWTSEYLQCRIPGAGVRRNTIVETLVGECDDATLLGSGCRAITPGKRTRP